jgi:hypothetical protein
MLLKRWVTPSFDELSLPVTEETSGNFGLHLCFVMTPLYESESTSFRGVHGDEPSPSDEE